MNYHFLRKGEQLGPVPAAEILRMERAGELTEQSYLWRPGLADWQSLETLRAELAAAAPATVGAEDEATEAMAICPHCHRRVERSSLILVAGQPACCALCKDEYVQRQVEGVPLAAAAAGHWEYAGFWIRFVAYFIDGILLNVVTFGLGFVFGLLISTAGPDATLALTLTLQAISLGIAVSYFVYFHGSPQHQATLGKKVMGLRVICADGSDVSFARALGRYFASILSGIIFAIGYIMAGFDDEKRALHDHICTTRVIYDR
jgi:uncharacterized RDD family membrane protein YckC